MGLRDRTSPEEQALIDAFKNITRLPAAVSHYSHQRHVRTDENANAVLDAQKRLMEITDELARGAHPLARSRLLAEQAEAKAEVAAKLEIFQKGKKVRPKATKNKEQAVKGGRDTTNDASNTAPQPKIASLSEDVIDIDKTYALQHDGKKPHPSFVAKELFQRGYRGKDDGPVTESIIHRIRHDPKNTDHGTRSVTNIHANNGEQRKAKRKTVDPVRLAALMQAIERLYEEDPENRKRNAPTLAKTLFERGYHSVKDATKEVDTGTIAYARKLVDTGTPPPTKQKSVRPKWPNRVHSDRMLNA